MIASGASGAIGTLAVIGEHLGNLFGPGIELTFDTIMDVLSALTFFAGIAIIVGGMVLTTRRFKLGRGLVFISIGVGVAGLIMGLVQLVMAATFVMPLAMQLAHSLGWIGAILSLVGWTVAEQPSVIANSK